MKCQRLNRARREGREEGKKENAILVARKLLGLNMPIDKIAEATDLSSEEIRALE
jgi:predicted transposase/invertase (TIGR01784 family)